MKKDFEYDTPQYNLVQAMDYTEEVSEKASEALINLIDAMKNGAGEYDPGDCLADAKNALTQIMSHVFEAMQKLNTVFGESVAAEEKKGEPDGNEEEN